MKKLLFIITIAYIVSSCTQKETKIDISILNGIWLNKNYLDHILKYKDPRSAQNIADISFIKFPHLNTNNALIVYSFHEGNGVNVKLEKNNILLGDDTIKIIDNNLTYNNTEFIKTSIIDEAMILEELIFSGSYIYNNTEIKLLPNGEIEGSDELIAYSVNIDYMDAGMNQNKMSIRNNERIENYGFIFNNDTLNIYDLMCVTYDSTNKICVEIKNGNQKYQLIKKD